MTDTYIASDPLELIDRAIANGEDAWAMLVSLAQADEEGISERRWQQGDAALRVEKCYGEGRIEDFAREINVNKNTIKQRRRMSAFYTPDTRYTFENVGYSHYRSAMKWGDLVKAMSWLEEVSESGWTADEAAFKLAERLGKPTRAKSIVDTIATACSPQDDKGEIVKFWADTEHAFDALKKGKRYRVIVKEASEKGV